MRMILIIVFISVTADNLQAQYFVRNLFTRFQWNELQKYRQLNPSARHLPLKCKPNEITKVQWNVGEAELMNHGRELLQKNDWEDEIVNYSNCIKTDSSFCDAYFRLAQCLVEKSDWVGVVNLLRLTERKFPNEPLVYLGLGQALLYLEYPTNALTNFKKLIELLPNSAEGYLGASTASYELGKPQEAFEYLHKGYEKTSSDVVYLKLYEGILYYQLNETQKAYNVLSFIEENRVTPLSGYQTVGYTKAPAPENYPELKGILNYYIGLCDVAKGEAYYDKAARHIGIAKKEGIDIDTTIARTVRIIIRTDDLKEQTLRLYDNLSVSNNSGDPATNTLINRKINEASLLFSQQIKNDSSDLYSYLKLAECYELLDQHVNALIIYKLAVKRFPRQERKLKTLLARQYVRTDSLGTALNINQEIIKAHPSDKKAPMRAALILAMMNKKSEALQLLKNIEFKVIQIPGEKITWDLAAEEAELLFLTGQYDQALKYFEFAIEFGRKDPYLNYYYGMCLASLDYLSDAKKYLSNAMELGAMIDKDIVKKYQLIER